MEEKKTLKDLMNELSKKLKRYGVRPKCSIKKIGEDTAAIIINDVEEDALKFPTTADEGIMSNTIPSAMRGTDDYILAKFVIDNYNTLSKVEDEVSSDNEGDIDMKKDVVDEFKKEVEKAKESDFSNTQVTFEQFKLENGSEMSRPIMFPGMMDGLGMFAPPMHDSPYQNSIRETNKENLLRFVNDTNSFHNARVFESLIENNANIEFDKKENDTKLKLNKVSIIKDEYKNCDIIFRIKIYHFDMFEQDVLDGMDSFIIIPIVSSGRLYNGYISYSQFNQNNISEEAAFNICEKINEIFGTNIQIAEIEYDK
jgi:hypothetical protein